jgi:hypothetical protein
MVAGTRNSMQQRVFLYYETQNKGLLHSYRAESWVRLQYLSSSSLSFWDVSLAPSLVATDAFGWFRCKRHRDAVRRIVMLLVGAGVGVLSEVAGLATEQQQNHRREAPAAVQSRRKER